MALKIGLGTSTKRDPILAAKEAFTLAITNIPEQDIDLAILFSTVNLTNLSLIKTISAALGMDVPIVGCSGAAVISNQGIFKHGLTLLLLHLPNNVFLNTASITDIKAKTALRAGEELGQKLLYGFRNVTRDLSIIFSDGLIEENSKLVYGLQERLGRSFPLIGASASDDLMFKRTYLYHNQQIFSDGACGVLFGGKLNFGLGINHGWKPLGKPREVTKCDGNIVYEIDNAPAVKLYEEYFACDLKELRKKLNYISILYPIGVFLPGEEEYLLRNLLSIRDDGSLIFQGNVPQGSMIRLMIGTKESCLNATKHAVEQAQKNLYISKTGQRTKDGTNFVLVFDSVSRYILLRRDAEKELDIIKKSLGQDIPIIGIYTYGEQAPLQAISYHGQTYVHNQTVNVLILGG
ncbi:MAG: FIST N-terminal domain-containing protein [Candidatus Omnitrophota bacterium]